MYNLLYCFISHKSVLSQDIDKWNKICKNYGIKNYLIVCGNNNISKIENNILYLNCQDTYEGLSDKTHKMFEFMIDNKIAYDYYAKIDRYIKINKPIDSEIVLTDYCGYSVQLKESKDGCRDWHFGKCSKNSEWNTKLYTGEFIPWCRGGKGYFLSNKSAQIISCHPPDLSYHIYEDLYVAEILSKYGNIKPKHLRNLTTYFTDLGDKI